MLLRLATMPADLDLTSLYASAWPGHAMYRSTSA